MEKGSVCLSVERSYKAVIQNGCTSAMCLCFCLCDLFRVHLLLADDKTDPMQRDSALGLTNTELSIGNLISRDSEMLAVEALGQLTQGEQTFVTRVSNFPIVNRSIEQLQNAYAITKNSSNVIKVY